MTEPLTTVLDRLISEVEIRAQVEAERDATVLARHGAERANQQLRQLATEQAEEIARLKTIIARSERQADRLGEAIRRLRDWRDRCTSATVQRCDDDTWIKLTITLQVRDDLTAYLTAVDQEGA